MDALTFISTIIGQVLSWPVAAVVIVILLKAPLSERLRDIRRIKTKYFEADFGTQLEEAEVQIKAAEAQIPERAPLPPPADEPLPKSRQELLGHLTELMPNAAILESWRKVERTLDLYFERRGVERPRSGQTIIGSLDYDPNFPPQLVHAYQELRLLRNRAAHAGENVTAEQAKEFIDLADRLTYALVVVLEQAGP